MRVLCADSMQRPCVCLMPGLATAVAALLETVCRCHRPETGSGRAAAVGHGCLATLGRLSSERLARRRWLTMPRSGRDDTHPACCLHAGLRLHTEVRGHWKQPLELASVALQLVASSTGASA